MTRKILVVDDDRGFAAEAADELRCEGFQVEMACSYPDARDKISREVYDVVSLDIMMPIEADDDVNKEEAGFGRCTGLVLYKQLRKADPQTKVVVCTVLAAGSKGLCDIQETVEPGTIILGKPVTVEGYLSAIRWATSASEGDIERGELYRARYGDYHV